MIATLQSIFLVKNLGISIANYFRIVESVEVKIDTLSKKDFESGYSLLEQARYIISPDVYKGILLSAVTCFTGATAVEKRERLLFAYLGLIICYVYLDETEAVKMIQEKVKGLKFKPTFWEKNSGDIKTVGTALAGIITVIASGGTAAAGVGLSAQASQEVKKEAMEELKIKEKSFNDLRNEISALRISFSTQRYGYNK